ncbi:hypothetical protein EON73_04810 [bacterium]|nr:MAG: hypothetical protein EON73_04810 [bacterium]
MDQNHIQLKDLILENRDVIFTRINDRLNTLETLIDQSNTFIQNKVVEVGDLIINLIRSSTSNVTSLINSISETQIAKMVYLSRDLK